jgi:hypothetical protein
MQTQQQQSFVVVGFVLTYLSLMSGMLVMTIPFFDAYRLAVILWILLPAAITGLCLVVYSKLKGG